MVGVGNVVLWDVFHQLLLYLVRGAVALAYQSQTMANAEYVGVDGHRGLAKSYCLYDIQIDTDNNKWLATAGDVGLASFNGSDWGIYNVDNSGIASNETTKITIDDKRDLIWLTHLTGRGLSVARLNSEDSGIKSVISENAFMPSAIYDLTGKQIKSPEKGVIYIKQGKKFILY